MYVECGRAGLERKEEKLIGQSPSWQFDRSRHGAAIKLCTEEGRSIAGYPQEVLKLTCY